MILYFSLHLSFDCQSLLVADRSSCRITSEVSKCLGLYLNEISDSNLDNIIIKRLRFLQLQFEC